MNSRFPLSSFNFFFSNISWKCNFMFVLKFWSFNRKKPLLSKLPSQKVDQLWKSSMTASSTCKLSFPWLLEVATWKNVMVDFNHLDYLCDMSLGRISRLPTRQSMLLLLIFKSQKWKCFYNSCCLKYPIL